MNLPPLTNPDNEGLDLGWHALNYRTAHTMHAEAMWQELKRYVENWGESCARMAREQALLDAATWCDEAPYLGKEAADCADLIRARVAELRKG